MKYRYIEFNDRTALRVTSKDGKLYYVGKPSEDLIAELELEEEKPGIYKTTLAALCEKGWELQFVTPCGVNFSRHSWGGSSIENSYIFRKMI